MSKRFDLKLLRQEIEEDEQLDAVAQNKLNQQQIKSLLANRKKKKNHDQSNH